MSLSKYPEGDVEVAARIVVLTEEAVVLPWYRNAVGRTHGDDIDLRAFQAWGEPEARNLREGFTILWAMDRVATTNTPWFAPLEIRLFLAEGGSGSV